MNIAERGRFTRKKLICQVSIHGVGDDDNFFIIKMMMSVAHRPLGAMTLTLLFWRGEAGVNHRRASIIYLDVERTSAEVCGCHILVFVTCPDGS